MSEKLKGVVCDILFENEENGFKICTLDCGEIVTVKGVLPFIHPGETIEATGCWEDNTNYGPQFRAENCETFMPKDPEDLIYFLQSDIFSGIGEITAISIVERFGDRTVEVLKNSPMDLAKVRGISLNKAISISEAFNEYEQMYEVFSFLRKLGIKQVFLSQIYKKYGSESENAVRTDPYILSEDISGLTFEEADRIAMSLGFTPDCNERVCAGITDTLKNMMNAGHVFYPLEGLCDEVSYRLGVSDDKVRSCVEILSGKFKVAVSDEGRYGTCVYLKRMYDYEKYVKEKLKYLSEQTYTENEKLLSVCIDSFEKTEDHKLGDSQREAIQTAVCGGLLVITGGPGTGKTTIIKAITKYFKMAGMEISLTAPTGRAAKRMTEACNIEAKTIHRLLEVNYNPEQSDSGELKFKKNDMNPLDADVIIADEASMIDLILMYHLLKAMKPGARLILVGDREQLPSVGPGKLLSDLISDSTFSRVILKEVYRQSSDSLIAYNAFRINNGQMPEMNDKDKDFFFIPCQDPVKCADTVVSLCTERLPKAYGFQPEKDIQVITPTKQGPCGTVALNKILQEKLNPPDIIFGKNDESFVRFRSGDRVMQVKNNYELGWEKCDDPTVTGTGVFNGEMGIVENVNRKNKNMIVRFDDDRFSVYDANTAKELELCYAITVHKSQGSEFDCCIIPIMSVPQTLQSRNILYTAVTRAKKLVVLLGSPETVRNMISNNRVQFRYTGMGTEEENFAEDNMYGDI